MNYIIGFIAVIVAWSSFGVRFFSDRINSDERRNKAMISMMCENSEVIVARCGFSYEIWPKNPKPGDGFKILTKNGKITECPVVAPKYRDPACTNRESCDVGDICDLSISPSE